ncbi:copia-type polyprotein [Tanacetum coccineum]
MTGLNVIGEENGPQLISNVPLILRKRSPLANVAKEDLESVSVWVKLHDVPITAFTEDGLSVIAIKLVTALTASMCMESWGLFKPQLLRRWIIGHAKQKDTYSIKDIGVTPNDSVNLKGEDAKVGNSKDVNVDNEYNVSENDVEEDDNETASFMASKSSKVMFGKKSLYERWKDNYDDNPYDDDKESEDLTEDQLALCYAFDISLNGQIRL